LRLAFFRQPKQRMAKHDTYYQGTRSELIPFIPKHYSKVLEVGCGSGGFRAFLQAPCEYWGVEPMPDPAAEAAQRMHTVLRGTFEAVNHQLPEQYFDLVICNDVIEHMQDHERFLRDIQNKMTRDGCMIGSIPNVRYYKNLFALLVRKDWRYTDKGILDATHLRFFTAKSLRRSFLGAGYHVERLSGIGTAIYFKKKYCTTVAKTVVNAFKFGVRFVGFRVFDLLTLYHGSDMKCAQFAFRIRRHDKGQEA
jgi:2-polyprenyl-3-methyl-5-hydroxy-6-metoxy-1,4-benzoquinol methylase